MSGAFFVRLLFGWLAKLLPGIILRLLAPPKSVAKHFEVDLRSEFPVHIRLDTEIPELSIWLRYTNKSTVPILVDRVVFEIGFGQPYVDGAILKRVEVQPKQTLENIVFKARLSEIQEAAIRDWYPQAASSNARITIHAHLYCDSKVGNFEIEMKKEHSAKSAEGFPPNPKYRRRMTAEDEFTDDFQYGLGNWEYYGDWKTEQENVGNILVVTNSDAGGIAKPCRLWDDYEFEFETKIVQSNSAWIIRASDILNYVMLQCSREEIVPHFKTSGMWLKLDPIPLPKQLPLNEWFRVRIKVTSTRVVITLIQDDKEIELMDNSQILEPNIIRGTIGEGESAQVLNLAFSYPIGSVGFREWGNTERAHFRKVRVTRVR